MLASFMATLGSLCADGFIAVTHPVSVPAGHFSFAPLEVSYHHVSVTIDGQISTTTVEEEFYNPNTQQLEGTYLFPVPKSAQIDKFSMEIGGKSVSAELLPADKARTIYEDIVRRKRDPALLEYADRSVFKVRIFPIEGRSRKHVKITYTEVLKSDSGLVSYLYPLNTEKFSSAIIPDVSVTVQINSKQPLASIYSPSHDVQIKRTDAKSALIRFEAKNVRPDSDFQLFFAPLKKEVAIDLLTYRTEDGDGYFLLLASPGIDTKTKAMPKDVTFVLDTSGSMASDNKLVQAKKALQFCLANLNENDRFEIVRFSSESEMFFGKLTPATDKAVAAAQKFVASLTPNGGTAIDEALRQSVALRSPKSERPYVIVFMTDGQPTVGENRIEKIALNADKALADGTRIFCFGLGTDVNAHLLDRIAERSRAVSDYVLPEEDIEIKVSSFFGKIREPVLANIKLTFPDDIRVSKTYPQALPDLFKGQQLILCGRYRGEGSGNCMIEGTTNGVTQKFAMPVTFPKKNTEQSFVARLWASRRVAYLLDEIRLNGENDELKNEATALAREFGLITPYTAFLILEDEQRRNVASDNQIMRELGKDRLAQTKARDAYSSFKSSTSGDDAVSVARSQNAMKQSTQVDSAMAVSNAEAYRTLNVPATVAGSSRTRGAPAESAASRLVQYTQQTRYVAQRAFYQNGTQWIDSNVSRQNYARNVRLKFGSQEYFDFVSSHPEARPYLALGQNVKVALNDTVYDIYDDASDSTPRTN